DVATATTVTTTLVSGDFTPGAGTLANNYALPTTASGADTITAKTLTAVLIGLSPKPYDGTTAAALTPANFNLSTLVTGESFTVTKPTGRSSGLDVATATTVTTTLAAGDFTAATGTLASNYTLPTTASGADTITQLTLTVTGITANNKPF